jgi:putative addiction module component (TIGR02574 family)
MTPKAESLLHRVLRLSDHDRVVIADVLVQSLSGFESAEVERAWLEEAQRRAAAIDSGEEETVPWEDMRERLNARIRNTGA